MNCLLSRILDLCAEHNINIRCIIVDGAAVNFKSMKLFGCKIWHSLEEINGGFTHWLDLQTLRYSGSITHAKFTTACNALSEQSTALDSKSQKIE